MKYVVLTFWTLLLGQIVGYIVASLAGAPIQVVNTLIISLIVEVFMIAIIKLAIPKEENAH
ncbi:MAG: YjzD family protein [Streptococcaceae bacterium]|jgi:uncharacterized protein YacL|nr:YjzD family protein [Streptococcaceae bacterium]